MPLTTCATCSATMSTEAAACPACGAPNTKPKKTKWWLWVPLGLGAAFLTFGFIAGNTPEGQERQRQRDAIAQCWSEQSRKSLDVGTSQFVAGSCETLEERYRKRWGRNP